LSEIPEKGGALDLIIKELELTLKYERLKISQLQQELKKARENLTVSPPFSWVQLRNMLPGAAFEARTAVGNFIFDDEEFEASLPQKLDVRETEYEDEFEGDVYYGQTRSGTQIREGCGTYISR